MSVVTNTIHYVSLYSSSHSTDETSFNYCSSLNTVRISVICICLSNRTKDKGRAILTSSYIVALSHRQHFLLGYPFEVGFVALSSPNWAPSCRLTETSAEVFFWLLAGKKIKTIYRVLCIELICQNMTKIKWTSLNVS